LNIIAEAFHFYEFKFCLLERGSQNLELDCTFLISPDVSESILITIFFAMNPNFFFGLASFNSVFVAFDLFTTKWPSMDLEEAVEAGGHHLEALEGEKEGGEVIRPAQGVEDELDPEVAEGSLFSTVLE
jgi:hypothetical protein